MRSEETHPRLPSTISLSRSARNDLDATGPLAPTDRIVAIDALRGIALFGVVIINLITEFRVSIFEQFLSERPAQSALDRGLEDVLMLLFAQKALSLFSLLFGVGLAIQFDRLNGNPRRLTLLLRRLAVLLAIGLVHLFLIWDGDILTEYALAGFLALPFLFGPRWLVATASAVCLAFYLLMPLLHALPFPPQSWIAQHVGEATRVYGAGGYAEVLAFRIKEVPAIAALHLSIFARTIALFLFGAFLWRTRLLRDAPAHRASLFACAATLLVIGIGFGAVTQGWADVAPSPGVARLLERCAPVILALGYAALVIATMATNGRRIFAWAAPLGRTAFTNYLLQSVVFGWIFYGYGLGLFGSVRVAAALAIGVFAYASQVLLSIWWLRRFRFGPVEWLWRTLMYGTMQPLRISPEAGNSA